MLKAYIHSHTDSHTFVSNDAKGLANSLESEDTHINVNYVLCNLTMMYKISYDFNDFLIGACHKGNKRFLIIYTQNKITVFYTVKHLQLQCVIHCIFSSPEPKAHKVSL